MTEDTTFQAIRALINRYDPEGLLDIAPEDEYDPEVRDLTRLVSGKEKITAKAVAELWLRWFEASDWPAQRPGDITEIAADLEAIRSKRPET